MDNSKLIFISYASEDREVVSPYYEHLISQGYNAWIDFKKIVGGQNWDFEIKKALSHASIILTFISSNSYKKRGYVQREIKIALDKLNEKLIDDIFIIPIQLENDIDRPDQLSGIQFIDHLGGNSLQEVVRSIDLQLNKFGEARENTKNKEDIWWSISRFTEQWEGLPGYYFEGDKINVNSRTHKNISEISDIINSDIIKRLQKFREYKFEQDSINLNFGMSQFSRMNTYDISFQKLSTNGRYISVRYAVNIYTYGAAHGNNWSVCYNFTTSPLTGILRFQDLFNETSENLKIIQSVVRNQITNSLDPYNDQDWIERGTKDWSDFDSFFITEEGIIIDFSPYHVAPYAAGTQQAFLEGSVLIPMMKDHFQYMMGKNEYL